MSKIRARGEAIRRFIFEQIEAHQGDIASVTAEQFGIGFRPTGLVAGHP